MRLNKTRKRARLISVIMLIVMFFNSPSTLVFGEALIKAFAATPVSITTPLSFSYGGASLVGDKYYSTSSYLSGGSINVTVPSGKVISKIIHGSQDITPPAAVGRNSYFGLVNDINGSSQDVVSIGNAAGTQGYYAWYRYMPGGSQGRNWYADVPDKNGNIVKISCGPDNFGPATYRNISSASTESINGYSMPTLPGCSTTDSNFSQLRALSLGATKDQPFTTSAGVNIPDSAVTNVVATSAQINTDLKQPIPGPDSYHSGYPRPEIISGIGVTPNTNDAGQYRVYFQQRFTDFDSANDSSRELGNPPNGAKVIVYYAAFVVDLAGKTYQYDNQVTVQYETPPNAPNLVVGAVTAPSCVEVNKATSFSFSFSNTGGADITTPFQAKVVIDGSTFQTYDYTGLAAGGSKTETFSKTFGGTSSYNVAVFVDTVTGESNTGDNNKSVTVTPQASCAATPIPEVVTGDFNIEKLTMPYGDSNTMFPVGVSVTGTSSGTTCAISQFGFIFEQDGIIRDYVGPASFSSTQGFSGPPYPGGMGEGSVNVKMKIVTTCGTTKVVGPKSFTITVAANNNPPFGSPGWFARGNTNNYPAIDEVVVDNYIDLGIIKDKSKTPEEPYDPEGDGFFPTWDFAGSSDPWIQNLGDKKNGYGFYEHDERFSNIKADVLGPHTVKMKLTDTRGAQSSWRSATINVVKPNPIAACDAPAQMKSNRPLAPSAINADKSRSPMGRTIDHSKDEWTNKQSTYTNNTGSDITVTVTLNKVYDSAGLASENSSSCNIVVHPDYPPIAKINAPTLGIRGEDFDVLNESYSPDGDNLTQTIWYVRYDANNDGVFDDATEPWTVVTGTLSKYVFHPTKVGKYKFKLRAIEEYGAWAEAESGVMDVINQAPEVSFDLSGNSPNPDPNPPQLYKASDVLKLWTLFATNTNSVLSKSPTYNWQNENEGLLSGAGKGKERQYIGANRISTPYGFGGATAYSSPFNDNGFGKNGVSIYKAMTSPNPGYSQPLLIPGPDGQPTTYVGGGTPIETDKVHLYFQLGDYSSSYSSGSTFYALNKNKIGRYQLDLVWSTGCSGCFSSGTYTHRWLDGNPYDYTLNYKNIPSSLVTVKTIPHYTNQTQDYTMNMSEAIEYGTVKFVYAEKTVYMLFTKDTPTKQIYDTSGDRDKTYTQWTYNSMACSFKALDGSLIGCFDVPGTNGSYTITLKDRIAKNDHLLFLFDSDGYYSSNGYFGNSFSEVDQYGNVVNTGTITGNNPWIPMTYEAKTTYWPSTNPASYSPPRYVNTSCSFNQSGGTPYKDRDGNTYFYEEKVCQAPDGSAMRGYTEWNMRAYPELGLGIYVAKYDKDYKIVWRARTGGNALYFSAAWNYDWSDNINTMIVNPLNNTIVTKTLYTVGGSYGDSRTIVNNTIDMTTGAVWGWGGPVVSGMSTAMHVDGAGNYVGGGNCPSNIYNQCADFSTGANRTLSGTVGFVSGATETVNQKGFSEYMGDGLLLSAWMYRSWVTGGGNPPYGETVYWIDKGPVAEAPAVTPRYQYGQFLSGPTASDADIMFNFKTDQVKIDTELFGFSFRMQDGMNRYALEFDGVNAYLAEYVNGVRTVISTSAYNIQDSKSYSVKIRTVGNTMNVWINKVNYFADIVDNTYAVRGKFGPFTNKSFVNFSAMTMKPYAEADLWNADYAIMDEQTGKADLKYDNVIFDDPEKDPMAGSFSWNYVHTPMFIDNGGVSPLSGKSFTSGQPTFDRVGKWDVSLKAKDDPYPIPKYKYPDMTFDAYRKNSNSFKKSIIVHRRPVAQFSLVMNSDGSVSWTDTSYDPDRYNVPTGHIEPGYETSRGIVERKYWFIAPDGTMSETKLDRITDSGTYTVGLQVKDEFGAWSWQETNTLDVGLKPNNPPKAVLTFPTGSKDTPDYLPVGSKPTITWNQTDIDPDTTYTGYEVFISQLTKNWMGQDIEYEGYGSGIKSFNTKAEMYSYLATIVGDVNSKWRVKVRVKDETTWSAWSNEGFLGSRRPPAVQLTFPTGTYDNPTPVTDLRPTIRWNQKDEDTGMISYQQIRVWAEDGTTVVASADISVPYANRSKLTDSWTMNVDAPRGSKLKVQLRVMNQNSVWSDWSNIGWMTTNSPPTATMLDPSGTQSSPTIYNTTKPTFKWKQTDPDLNTVFSYFQIQVTNEDNTVMVLDSSAVAQNTGDETGSWNVTSDLPAGQKLRVRVRVYDGYVWSDFSAQTWLYINRAPVADFDWSPKPVWEGDLVQLNNASYDLDGDPLTYEWKIQEPDGIIYKFTSRNITHQFHQPGNYRVTLMVSDGYLASTLTKFITAVPLTIQSEVNYTDDWLKLHEKSGHQTVLTPKDFYSGEIFVVSSRSSPAPVLEVTSWIDTIGLDGRTLYVSQILPASSGDATLFQGELFDPKFQSYTEGLPQGLQQIHFKIRYRNGVVKTEDIPVQIIGNVNKSVGVHRVQ
ncbi:PKD domain-containing protein [Paenibacillus sp. GCM10027628]|uniref:PKD domain-containing protein n=1 Tax=Paenibacillus sp. GCM10027628 TaxID=3273413 RepID=UPI00362D379F